MITLYFNRWILLISICPNLKRKYILFLFCEIHRIAKCRETLLTQRTAISAVDQIDQSRSVVPCAQDTQIHAKGKKPTKR